MSARDRSAAAPGAHRQAIVWHDVENGGYAADLPLWRDLARELAPDADARILELGCGTGRVTLDLARAGHDVLGIDLEAAFTSELNRRATERGLPAGAVPGDIASGALPGQVAAAGFRLVIGPMQVIQLLRSADERARALATIATALAPGGVVALAIVEEAPAAPTGDEGTGDRPPLPDVLERDGWVYSSLPIAAQSRNEEIQVRRLRHLVSPAGELTEDVDLVRLAMLTADQLEAEARAAGLTPAGRRQVPATADHIGSTVVLLRRVEAST